MVPRSMSRIYPPSLVKYHIPQFGVDPGPVGVGTGATAVGDGLGWAVDVAPTDGQPPFGLRQIVSPTRAGML